MRTCSFFGHRNTVATPELCETLRQTVIRLIEEKDVKQFLFGSASKFDDLCLKTVTELQKEYPEIKRMYVRSHYPYIDKLYRDYLLESYDDTIMPSKVKNAGRASYVERNQEMINASDFCVFYYDEEYEPPLKKQSKRALFASQPKSGTRLAYEYARQKEKEIINLYR
ncbi:MAG: DUF1273 family protein [Clostridia bacterium]|nr:DUF1273 family protein [Clostridia bacterium]